MQTAITSMKVLRGGNGQLKAARLRRAGGRRCPYAPATASSPAIPCHREPLAIPRHREPPGDLRPVSAVGIFAARRGRLPPVGREQDQWSSPDTSDQRRTPSG